MSQGLPTYHAVADVFYNYCDQFDSVANQTVAHRKKSLFCSSMFRNFSEQFQRDAPETEISQNAVSAYREIVSLVKELQDIMSSNFVQCWAHTLIQNTCNQVAQDFCGLISRLHDEAMYFDPDAASCFDSGSSQWTQYHILDLKAIKSSLEKFLQSPSNNQEVVDIMKTKLVSIDTYLNESGNNEFEYNTINVSAIPVHYQNWRLKNSDFVIEKEIGSGVSAVVYFGHMKTGEEVAIKKLKFKKLTGDKLDSFQREISILATVNHECILKFFGATDVSPFCILTQWMGGGSLYHDIHKNHKLNQTKLTIAAIDIARGMHYLHSRNIIHRDLKTLNVLLDDNGHANICDFGVSKQLAKEEDMLMTNNIGTPHWMAPELLSGNDYNNKIDVYAYGILLWELLSKKLPYSNLETPQIVVQVILKDLRPTIPKDTPEEIRKLIEKCWTREPNDRPSFSEILEEWGSGKIYFPGADPEKVQEYLLQHLNEFSKQVQNLQSQISSPESNVQSFYESFKAGISNEVADKFWNVLESISYEEFEKEFYIRSVGLFLNTSSFRKAAACLRKMPNHTIPKDIVITACSLIPTGNEEADLDLTMIACKNNAASEAALHCMKKEHLLIVFEVLARNGILNNEEEIVKRCIKLLSVNKDDIDLCVSSLRCLIGNKKTREIPLNIINKLIQSKNQKLQLPSYIAVAKMTEEGVVLPNEMLEMFISNWNENSFARTVVVNSCNNYENAYYMINRLNSISSPPIEVVTRILIKASMHQELHSIIKANIEQLTTIGVNAPNVTKALEKLSLIVN